VLRIATPSRRTGASRRGRPKTKEVHRLKRTGEKELSFFQPWQACGKDLMPSARLDRKARKSAVPADHGPQGQSGGPAPRPLGRA
jgi:hypothetical protein